MLGWYLKVIQLCQLFANLSFCIKSEKLGISKESSTITEQFTSRTSKFALYSVEMNDSVAILRLKIFHRRIFNSRLHPSYSCSTVVPNDRIGRKKSAVRDGIFITNRCPWESLLVTSQSPSELCLLLMYGCWIFVLKIDFPRGGSF